MVLQVNCIFVQITIKTTRLKFKRQIIMKYKSMGETLVQLKNKDLALRDALIQAKQLSEGYHPAMQALHQENAAILDSIIDQIGYPSLEKVGKEASEAAWLIIQHAIGLPEFMKKCRQLLEDAVQKKEATPQSLAYLTDRIAVLEGNPQLYGTQFDWDKNGTLTPCPFDDAAKVNQRRKSIGLNTLEAQTKLINAQAKQENQSPPTDFEQRKKALEDWRKKVGWIN